MTLHQTPEIDFGQRRYVVRYPAALRARGDLAVDVVHQRL